MQTLGLVLSGGGARAAYQAGALAAIGDICSELKIKNPFQIYSGVSAGAVNTSVITSHDGNFSLACKRLLDLWSNIESEDVFVSNPVSLTGTGIHWLLDLSMGGIKKSTPGKSLLDTAPLRKLIEKHVDFSRIQKKIDTGEMQALAITALDYLNANSTTFVQGIKDTPSWNRVRRKSVSAKITVDHLMASAAIPILFPPVEVDPYGYFGDGSIRNLSPCAPAIFLGCDRILAIGVRCKSDPCNSQKNNPLEEAPTVAHIVSVLLHAVMMDGIELDIERIERINRDMKNIIETERKKLSVRIVDALWIAPSRDLSEIAANKSGDLPRMIRYLLRGLGSLEEASEITSFLLFEKTYCQHLQELGFEDAMRQKEQIVRFFTDENTLITGQQEIKP